MIAVSTEIGRGHPNYLDSVWQILERKVRSNAMRRITVFETSHGLALLGWRALRTAYRLSARNRLTIALYNATRRGQADSGPSAWVVSLLGSGLRQALAGFPGICLVEHQVTARMLSDVCRTWYVHADVAAPPECVFPGPERVFVPLEVTEQGFRACPGQVVRTGLVIEPDLVAGAHDAFHRRLERLESSHALRVAFFASGAYPAPHVRKILLGIKSVLKHKMQAVLFCGPNRRFLTRMDRLAEDWAAETDLDCGTPLNPALRVPHSALSLVYRSDRRADTAAAAGTLPAIDVFVAPAHERVNWALGLGLPLIALFPMIGTHAQANYDFCFRQGVAYPLHTDTDANNLGPTLERLRANGALAKMSKCGFGRFPIDGAERIAGEVIARLPPAALRG